MSADIMIDLETLAVPEEIPRGSLVEVVEIGAVKFNDSGEILEQLIIHPKPCNGLCSAGTVQFWMNQIEEKGMPEFYRKRQAPEKLPSMKEALQELTRFIGGFHSEIWSKGGFDLQILSAHYAENQLIRPWQYFKQRDLRSVMKFAGVFSTHGNVSHNALEDARAQVELLMECRGKLAGAA